jgi:hypothetical protein
LGPLALFSFLPDGKRKFWIVSASMRRRIAV